MLAAGTYLDQLVRSLRARPEQATWIRLRTLLRRFGYVRRHRDAVAFIRDALAARGLIADLSLRQPARLDDRVSIRLAPPGAAGRAWSPRPTRGSLADRHATRLDPRASRQAREGAPENRQAMAEAWSSLPDTPDADRADLSTIAERAIAATVEIFCGDGTGTGFVVHPDGLVVTACHVVTDGDRLVRHLRMSLANGRRIAGVLFRAHAAIDYALIWLGRPGPFASLSIGDPRVLRPAETVLAIGHPALFRNTVSRGIVSNPRRVVSGVEYIQTDAAIDRGNSGGPLINRAGEVVGINSWEWGDVDSGKFAVPIDYLQEDMARAIEAGRRRCLGGTFCLRCGHLEQGARPWYCPNCGSQLVERGA